MEGGKELGFISFWVDIGCMLGIVILKVFLEILLFNISVNNYIFIIYDKMVWLKKLNELFFMGFLVWKM